MAVPPVITSLNIEFEFTSGVWTNIGSGSANYIDEQSNIQWSRGVDVDRKPYTSQASFSLDNGDEVFTPANTSSPYYNKLVKGIGVRFWTLHLGPTTRHHFRGVVTDIRHYYPEFIGNARVEIQCEGYSSLLVSNSTYSMATQQNASVSAALAAIMAANGNSNYLFDTSLLTIPYVYPRGNALADLVGVAQSEMAGLLWEDGQGRLRFKRIESMVGGFSTPTRTWGTTIAPIGDIVPEYRNDAQYARQVVNIVSPKIATSGQQELYHHPLDKESGLPDYIEGNGTLIIEASLEHAAVAANNGFSPGAVGFTITSEILASAIDATTTTVITQSQGTPYEFVPGEYIRIESEAMYIGSVAPNGTNSQKLTVTRAQLGTIAAAHGAPGGIAVRKAVEELTNINAYLWEDMANVSTPSTLKGNGGGVQYGGAWSNYIMPGSYLKIEDEVVRITALLSNAALPWSVTVTRGEANTSPALHRANAPVYFRTITYPADALGDTRVRSSETPLGEPQVFSEIRGSGIFPNGNDILIVGTRAWIGLLNVAATRRYISELVIGGSSLEEPPSVPVISEKAIPGISGYPEGDSFDIPFGVPTVYHGKAISQALLRQARLPAAWLALTFEINDLATADSLLAADIGDLVRYTGTGTGRERIDEWYRVVGISGTAHAIDYVRLTIRLAPALLWRNPNKCFYTGFRDAIHGAAPSASKFPTNEAGAWVNASQWRVAHVVSATGVESRLSSPAAAPTPMAVDIGSADQVVGTSVGGMLSNTYPANTGGIGVAFRGNSAMTQRWEARFNRSSNLVILWNSTDGVVATAAWTAVAASEFEVRAQDTRIRIYINCQPEPLIDVTSTRFQTQTFAGITQSKTTINNNVPYAIDFYGQAV